MPLSTKILSVLVALMVLVSIYFLAQVSELNRNWGAAIEAAEAEAEDPDTGLRKQLAELERQVIRLEQETRTARAATDAQLQAVRLTIAELQKEFSFAEEIRLRAEIALEEEQRIRDLYEQTNERLTREIQQFEQDLASAQNRLDRLAAENAELTARLDDLGEQFRVTFAENQELLERVADEESTQAAAAGIVTAAE